MDNIIETIPNPKNFCGGNFQDWLEVYLTGKCNGKCSFCIDKYGFKPDNSIEPKELVKIILDSGQKNILLLGGEPTLYKGFGYVTKALKDAGRNVTVTTNGSHLSNKFTQGALKNVSCVNISIHHYDRKVNTEITGIKLIENQFNGAVKSLQDSGVDIRINCNIIKGFIDSENEVINFLNFAWSLDIKKVRFAELKNDDRFVSLAKIFNNRYGLNEDPFIDGCWQNTILYGMHVNFRQLCGMQTNKRAAPINPKQILKKVLYYDGKLYDGWQSLKENDMSKAKSKVKSKVNNAPLPLKESFLKGSLVAILEQVASGDLDTNSGAKLILALTKQLAKIEEPVPVVINTNTVTTTGSGCVY